jgi:hypothetical protein
MKTGRRQVSKSASTNYCSRNFNCMYASTVESKGNNSYYCALIFQGTHPNPHFLEAILQFLSEGRGTMGHLSEPMVVYNVDPSKIFKVLGSDVQNEQDMPGVYMGEQARRIIEKLQPFK